VIRSAAQNLQTRITNGAAGMTPEQRRAQTWALERLQVCLREYDAQQKDPNKRIHPVPVLN